MGDIYFAIEKLEKNGLTYFDLPLIYAFDAEAMEKYRSEMASPIFNISGDDYQKTLANYDSLLKDCEEFLGYSD